MPICVFRFHAGFARFWTCGRQFWQEQWSVCHRLGLHHRGRSARRDTDGTRQGCHAGTDKSEYQDIATFRHSVQPVGRLQGGRDLYLGLCDGATGKGFMGFDPFRWSKSIRLSTYDEHLYLRPWTVTPWVRGWRCGFQLPRVFSGQWSWKLYSWKRCEGIFESYFQGG